ncbi:xanthine dehydrogenase family protein molybdopterin-binding subunit [Candidatus Chloroploca sp. Khr17]|uniref:xanthine dehydrogenase family protein molybdopterin-binding subunit n=1 Tax=Candidatus Chloroploca sp. Khr17 TaxID=2496869 RepID=UPI00101D1922|nr:molybdopterin cofactor-binding domain-containing protein [Candidatus Chloroploca sp. Khr17]
MAYAKMMGAEVKRNEDPRLIQGAGTYVGDLNLPGMLYVAVVRSPYAHASVCGFDLGEALAMPGVVTIVTGNDLLAQCQPLPLATSGEGEHGEVSYTGRTRYTLAVERVRYVGEAVAAVIAASYAEAVDAAYAVVVDYDPLPVVADPLRALEPDAPVIFTGLPDNLDHRRRRQRGDVVSAFANAQRLVRQRMVNQRLCGFPLEGRAVVAVPDHMTGGLTVYTSTQTPHQIRSELAKVLRMSTSHIRVIAPDVGGGFGVKIGLYPEEALCAALAQRLKAPVRWVEERMEHMQATTHGRGQVAELEAAVEADGTVTALRMQIIADLGAYPLAPGLPDLTTAMGVGVYKIPAVDLEAISVYTNTTPVAAYRGAGRPEAAYYIERLMDCIAAELGLDPVEVRRRNFIPPDAFPYKTPTGLTYDTGEYDRALSKALELAGYEQLRREQAARRQADDPVALGIGLACYVEMCGFGPYESAQIKVEPSGAVTVTTGISPHGQGTGTTFAQIVADQIGADFAQIVVRHGDTATTPMGIGTMGSRSLAVGGGALMRAAEVIRTKAMRLAAYILEVTPEELELVEGRYQERGVPSNSVTLVDLAQRAYSNKLPPDVDPGLEATDYFRPPELIYPFGAHVAVVEVDLATGNVHLRNYYSVDDCGPRISPIIVAGQVHGGLAQGIAQALLEEVVYDANGQLLTGSLMDYALPRADIFPAFTLDKTETPTPLNPLGVKGIGEAATIGSTPAITNAVIDALAHLGIRHLDMPLRSEKIWRAVQTKE